MLSDEKQKAKSAIMLLRNLFNKDLASLVHEDHPIVQNLCKNLVPWTRRWLISLAEAIQILSSQINGSKILSMLQNKVKYREALLQLFVGKCLVDSYFSLEFIQETNSRSPDWKITDLLTKNQFLVELTEISNPTPQQEDIYLTFKRVSNKITKILRSSNNPRLVCMGRLFANFVSMPVLEALFKRIDLAAESAKKNGFEQLVGNDTLILAFATEPNDHTLRTWAIQKGVVDSERELQNPSTSSFFGPKHEIEESYRIKQRIKDKKGQFDRKNLNILVIKDDHFFNTALSIPKYFGMVEQFVYERDYLAMLIIVGGHVRQKMVNDRTIENIFERGQSSLFTSRN